MKESSFQFSKPVLKDVEYKILEQYEQGKEVNLHRHFHRNIVRFEDQCRAIVELEIKIGCDSRSVNSPFSLKLTIFAQFKWDDQIDEEIINDLLTMNAPSLLLSYARPIIANITSNSIWQYDLPFMNFTDEE